MFDMNQMAFWRIEYIYIFRWLVLMCFFFGIVSKFECDQIRVFERQIKLNPCESRTEREIS